jgi:hypothetical protein
VRLHDAAAHQEITLRARARLVPPDQAAAQRSHLRPGAAQSRKRLAFAEAGADQWGKCRIAEGMEGLLYTVARHEGLNSHDERNATYHNTHPHPMRLARRSTLSEIVSRRSKGVARVGVRLRKKTIPENIREIEDICK